MESVLSRITVPKEIEEVLQKCPGYTIARTTDQLVSLSCRNAVNGWHEVGYQVEGYGLVAEARVCRVKNGIAANYYEPYMRRRDSECMVIGDEMPSDKPRYKDRYKTDFAPVRKETFDWLSKQELAVFFFRSGDNETGKDSIAVCPANAGFFALGLAMLQGILDPEKLDKSYKPTVAIYVAPPFRHTHYEGKQVVVHNRSDDMHEIFSYNLYPGPSAKKGIYGVLLNQGEKEGWTTAHCSTVRVTTPYNNTITFMHEGASGGGKSEMLEHIHRQADGTIVIAEHLSSGEKHTLSLPTACELKPVTDDMGMCLKEIQRPESGKLTLADAENAWFLRVNHITNYGTDPDLETRSIHPDVPLLFLNIDAQPGATALLWEHIEDKPGVPCPNPRFVLPRDVVPGIVNQPVTVDIRSFGVRMPPCTKENPTYGIMGLFHIIPPALAWIWRLVSPRGFANPSIVDTGGISSEGVGSYWPFVTGRRVPQANLLLEQFMQTNQQRYVLVPNQNIGAWKVGFTPQWIMREYLARRGLSEITRDQVVEARCPLLGYTFQKVVVEGVRIGNHFLRVETQPEVGEEAYDRGAKILTEFFHEQLRQYFESDLMPEGKRIIEACLDNASVTEYEGLIDSIQTVV